MREQAGERRLAALHARHEGGRVAPNHPPYRRQQQLISALRRCEDCLELFKVHDAVTIGIDECHGLLDVQISSHTDASHVEGQRLESNSKLVGIYFPGTISVESIEEHLELIVRRRISQEHS